MSQGKNGTHVAVNLADANAIHALSRRKALLIWIAASLLGWIIILLMI
jgi:hypothetical protein